MLFFALACFSPSVPAEMRRLWVKNGGRLTHTDADFRKAEFFFCDGMKDPWLRQLRSRSSIVRHAAWVALCVAEQFVMPIADYTLDDRFDESKIVGHQLLATAQVANSEPKRFTGKRLFDQEDALQSCVERPSKRPRIDLRTTDMKELTTNEGMTEEKTAQASICDAPRAPYLPLAVKPKSVSQRVKKFESLIHAKVVASKGILRSTLEPHALFWNDLFARSFSRDQDCRKKLTLKIDDLIDAPNVKAGVFTVNEMFLGKRFINRDYV